jgi:hypothetical protein
VSPTLSLSSVFTTSGHLACYSFPLFYGVYAMYIYMYIYIYLHMLIYKKNCALTFPRPPSLVATRWGSRAWMEPTVLQR